MSGESELNLHYPPLDRAGDDIRDSEGQVLPHWQYVLDSLSALPADALAERQSKALRLLRDDGATYNVYSDDINPPRIWGLDLVPNVISSEEWADIEAGLLERSELLNLLLRDLYGPRTLIRTGVLPPEALFSHRGFLRACQGVRTPGEHELITHAVDMVRGADGNMLVLADRTQCPSGAGYALENRTVMSRTFPSLFRDSHVHRLAAYFQQLRSKLLSLCPNRARPRVAVLTPGPRNETYFEHAYIANYLGFYLVQSDDLIVRNGFLWMKSLDGLNRVDVLLRRVDDWFCDPVELRSDSRLGVPGLLEVVRTGNLVVANPLGSGVLENPVLLKYLPGISKALLGRELRMPTVQTYWCGDEQDKAYVLEHLQELVIKPINRRPGELSINAGQATAEELDALKARIMQNPLGFVAQPVIGASYIPTLDGAVLTPRPGILRTFTVAGTSSYSVMPGGLTRVGLDEGAFIISSQTGASSKDTWVVASEPERLITNQPAEDQAAREADMINLPSRVLENLYWMGRYAERAEAALRLLRTTHALLNGEEPVTPAMRTYLLRSLSSIAATAVPPLPESDEAMGVLLREGAIPHAIAGVLNSMLFCADEAKELLSSDTYRVINDIRDALPVLNAAPDDYRTADEVIDPLVTALMALSGLNHESMMRGYGWRFMELGRRLERALQSSGMMGELLGPVLAEPEQSRMTEALLLTLEGLISYRRRYGARTAIQTGLDLVMLDTDNPRSLLYQLDQMLIHIRKLPNNKGFLHELPPAERALVSCATHIRLSILSELTADQDGERQGLREAMAALGDNLMQISDMISDRYFDHREESQQLVTARWEGL